MKRRAFAVVGLAVALAVLGLWRCHGRHADEPAVRPGASAPAITRRAEASHRRPDPQTLARASIAGTITDDVTKAPVAHAHVCADGHAPGLPDELMRDPMCSVADERGAYVIGNLLPATYQVSASAKTYRPALYHPGGDPKALELRVTAGQHATGIDLALRGGGVEVTGIVSDITGGPVGKALVVAHDGGWRTRGAAVVTETDEQGAFSLWVAPGSVAVSASADGYADADQYLHAPGRAEIFLTPESTLAGTVIDAATGQPVEGATVHVESTEWSAAGSTSTFSDAHGVFRVARLAPGRVTATATTEHGYGRSEGSALVGLGQHIDGVVVKLFPAHAVTGTVLIAGTKTPCPEAYVGLRDEAADRSVGLVARDDGTVAADGVRPGTYSVDAGCPGYQSRDTYPKLVITDKDATDLTWEVDAGATITGRVLTKRGDAVEDADVWARSVGGAARDKGGWGGGRSTRGGRYELPGIKPGSYRIEVSTERGTGPKDGYAVTVAAGAKVEQDLVLDDAGSIKGSVVDTAGKPVAGVQISARAIGGTFGWGGNGNRSDEDGNFQLDGLRPGDYRVIAQRTWSDQLRKPGTTDDSTQGEKVTVRAKAVGTVRLVVESQTGSIKGIVVDAAGAPVADAFVSAVRESDAAGAASSNVAQSRWRWDDRPVVTSTDGTFVVEHLSPGIYTVRAYRKGGGDAIAEHVALSTSARLQIKPTGSIEGTAHRGGGGPPIDEMTVAVEDRTAAIYRSETFYMTGGHFVLRDLPKGHFQLTVTAAGSRNHAELDLAEGETKTGISIELEELLTLTGHVVDFVTKAPVSGVRMFAMDVAGGGSFSFGGDDQTNITDESGAFTIKNAPRGKLVIRGFPKDRESDYGAIATVRALTGTSTGTVDLGELGVFKKRVQYGEPVGELGINFKEPVPGSSPEDRTFVVSWIDPAGPAAKTELQVGDVVTAIDGFAITGPSVNNAFVLMRAPPGTKLALGLARGATVTITLAAP